VVTKRYGVILLSLLLGFVIAFWVTYRMPERYESFATIEVRPIPSTSEARNDERGPGVPFHQDGFVKIEIEKIKSRNILLGVVDALELDHRWGVDREKAYQILRKTVRATQITGTDLINIRARFENPEDARDVIAELARIYGDYRAEVYRYSVESLLEYRLTNELRKAIIDQEQRVASLREALEAAMSNPASIDLTVTQKTFESEQALLRHMRLKILDAPNVTRIPMESIILHDEPMISDHPASPNLALNLILGTTAGLIFGIGTAIFLEFLVGRNPPLGGGN